MATYRAKLQKISTADPNEDALPIEDPAAAAHAMTTSAVCSPVDAAAALFHTGKHLTFK